MEDNPKNYLEAIVYKSNLYVCKNSGEYFTVCNECKKPAYIKKLDDGYCPDCNAPLADLQGHLITPEDVENMMFGYKRNINDKIVKLDQIVLNLLNGKEFDLMDYIKSATHHVGVRHRDFKMENGYLASSYIGEEEFNAFGETYKEVSWHAGYVVSDEIFEKAKDGEYNGFSLGATGKLEEITEYEEEDNE